MKQLFVIEEKFFQLLQIAVGNNSENTIEIAADEWSSIYQMSLEQSLLGVVLNAVDSLITLEQRPPQTLLLQWIGESEVIRNQSQRKNQQCEQLTAWFRNRGFKSCVLKGQGVARLYHEPDLRQAGDIDIWVDAPRDTIVKTLRDSLIGVSNVDYVNCHVGFFSDTEVEVHFRPTYMFNPFTNWKVQKWLSENKIVQMANMDQAVGFCYPTIGFDLVFSMIHIYRHVFLEGIGLRQLMDYYHILSNSTQQERSDTMLILKNFGLTKFASTVMYILRKVFGVDSSLLLCEPNVAEGDFLLGEILQGGNFGHFDERNTYVPEEQKLKRGLYIVKRNGRFLKHYPGEVLWMPLFKMWHWCWRKWKGYL